MTIFLTIIVIVCALGAVFSLVRGLVAFLKAAEIDLKNPTVGASASSLQQNKMMTNRLLFQGAAILAIVLIMALARP
jgi:Hypoxia induced protein conserved region